MSPETTLPDIGVYAIMKRYAGASWNVRQSELLDLPLLLRCQERIGKSEKTLRRWAAGEYPIPLYAAVVVAEATEDWRLPQSYILECNKTFAPIGARLGKDVEIELMHVTQTFAEYMALFLRIKNKQSVDPDVDLQRLQTLEAQLHEDLRGSIASLILAVVNEQKGKSNV